MTRTASHIDVRTIAPRERHPLIFSTFDRLAAGEALELVNDHDPGRCTTSSSPRCRASSPGSYLEQGPDTWRVAITRVQAGRARHEWPVLRVVRRRPESSCCNHEEQHHEKQDALALARTHLRAVVRRPRFPGLADLPDGPADPPERRQHPTARSSSPGEQIQRGQQVWLAAGGQQQGSVWGHGAYVAPDWSADWLHREAIELQQTAHQGAAQATRPR